MDLILNVDKVIGLIGASFAMYYIILEILDWFKVIDEGLKPKKEFAIQSITPIQTSDKLPNEILNIIEELKTTVALQTAVPPEILKPTTPDLSDIKLSGLTTKVKDKVGNL